MNNILEAILEARNNHYVHELEVETTYEIENAIESIANEFPKESEDTLKEFFNTMEIHYIENEFQTENEVHNFNTDKYITNNISF